MMNWIETKNNEPINLNEIPCLNIVDLRKEILEIKKRVVGFFGQPFGAGVKLFVIMADDEQGKLFVSSAYFNENEKSYDSITKDIPAFHMFEREFFEEFKIKPLKHPWLKPVRNHKKEYPFFEIQGEEIHQVGVGPIHAGVIEPGHFRFMCNGEKVYDLEIRLGYQHRGVEDLFLQNPTNQLAESVCGDSVIAYNLAYSKAMEALLNIEVSNKAQLIRLIALEMERVAIHIGDLGAIAGDTAYQMGNAIFGATRTLVINSLLEISGSRFGRGLIKVGGVNFDIDEKLAQNILKTLEKVGADVKRTTTTMLKSATVISRLERTGVVSYESAKALGLVGMAGRASGVELDSRFDFPDKWFMDKDDKKFKATGDVYSRTRLRYKEIMQSLSLIRKFMRMLPEYKNEPLLVPVNNGLYGEKFVVSIVEGWRGEVIHTAITDNNGRLSRYKIKDPSFNNWYGLAMAVRNNGISDFPLCNKSFNLSYCGNDL
ncbi:hydrogenase [bacterium]|nr:hydrogenase [bacterium]